jgi:hypothetical protein
MAGSRKWFLYTTNGGTNYALNMDESNGEAVGNTDLTSANNPNIALPRNIKPRYALYRSDDGKTSRKIPVTANNVDLADLPANFLVASPIPDEASITVRRQSLHGEVQLATFDQDTGQDDGDNT